MSYLSYSPYISHLLYIALSEWKSDEIIKCLPITNSGFAGSKPLGGLKRVPGTPRNLVANIKLSPWNGCRRLRHLNSVHGKGLHSSFSWKE